MKHHADVVIPVQDFLRTNAMKETLVYRKELRNWIPEWLLCLMYHMIAYRVTIPDEWRKTDWEIGPNQEQSLLT